MFLQVRFLKQSHILYVKWGRVVYYQYVTKLTNLTVHVVKLCSSPSCTSSNSSFYVHVLYRLMLCIINDPLLLLLQAAPMRSSDEITWRGRERERQIIINEWEMRTSSDRHRDTLVLLSLRCGVPYSRCSHNDARGDEGRRRRRRREDGGVRQAGRG